jgi:hypothetical protein
MLSLLGTVCVVEGRNLPIVVPAEDVPKYGVDPGPLFCGGICFYQDKLYASSGPGLLEISSNSLQRLYMWHKDGSAVEGPWADSAHGLLWIRLWYEYAWAYFDGKTWGMVKEPKPTHGYISRGDEWRGFRCVSNQKTFWLEGAGRAWVWKGAKSGKWAEEIFPAVFGTSLVPSPLLKRMIPVGDDVYYVIRDKGEPGIILEGVAQASGLYDRLYGRLKGDSVYYCDKGQWYAVTNRGASFFTVESGAGNSRGYIRTKSGDVLQVTKSGVSAVNSPGLCDAIVGSATGTLLAGFRELGVYELKDEWHKVLGNPYPKEDRDYRVDLASQKGRIAFAVLPLPVRSQGSPSVGRRVLHGQGGRPALEPPEPQLSYNARPGIWISDGSEWREVVLPMGSSK